MNRKWLYQYIMKVNIITVSDLQTHDGLWPTFIELQKNLCSQKRCCPATHLKLTALFCCILLWILWWMKTSFCWSSIYLQTYLLDVIALVYSCRACHRYFSSFQYVINKQLFQEVVGPLRKEILKVHSWTLSFLIEFNVLR